MQYTVVSKAWEGSQSSGIMDQRDAKEDKA